MAIYLYDPVSNRRKISCLNRYHGMVKLCEGGNIVVNSSKVVTDKGNFQWHRLKTWPEYFEALIHPDIRRRKMVEIRKNDRDYQVGDCLCKGVIFNAV